MPRPRIQRLLQACALGFLAVASLALPARAAPAGAVDTGPCVAFDVLGYRYVAFGRTGVAEPGIYLATNRSGRWRLSAHPIANGVRCEGIVVDAHRHVHLLAVRPLTEDPISPVELRYVTDISGAWRSSLVYGGEIGDASLAIDRTGLANVGVRDQEGFFLFQRATTGGWIRRFVDYGHITHLRADPTGTLWAVTVDDSLRRMRRLSDQAGIWVSRRIAVPYPGMRQVDLSVDGAGRRFLVSTDSEAMVTIYRDVGGSWSMVVRTRLAGPRLMREADTEPSGAIHMLLWFRRSESSFAIVDMNRHDGLWHTQLVGYASSFRSDIAVDTRGRVAATFDRDGVVWSYWNDWSGPPHRFRVSDL